MKQRAYKHFMTIALTVFILSPVLSIQETAIPSMPYVLAMTLPPIFYSISLPQSIQLKPYQIASIFLPILAIISSVFSDVAELDFRIFKYMLLVFYFVVITSYRFKDIDLLFVGKIYVALSIILGFLILLSYKFGYVHNDSTYYMGRYSIGITGLYKNPNYLTSFMNLALFVILYRLFFCQIKNIQKYVTVVILMLFLISFYLSGTRASLVTFIIYTFFSFLYYIRKNSKNGKLISIVMAFVFLIGLTTLIVRNLDEIGSLVDMFVGNREFLGDDGRINSWSLALKKMSESIIFGQGLYSWHYFSGADDLNYLHNVFIEFSLYQGLIGLIVLLFVILNGYSKIKVQDRVFVYGFLFVSAFPLFFQNGLIDVNFFKFLIMNRVVVNYSTYSKEGIVALLK